MDIKTDRITEAQVGKLSSQARNSLNRKFRDHLPAEWKAMAGYPAEADYRLANLERWIRSNLSKSAASACITTMTEGNEDGCLEILKNNGCPIV